MKWILIVTTSQYYKNLKPYIKRYGDAVKNDIGWLTGAYVTPYDEHIKWNHICYLLDILKNSVGLDIRAMMILGNYQGLLPVWDPQYLPYSETPHMGPFFNTNHPIISCNSTEKMPKIYASNLIIDRVVPAMIIPNASTHTGRLNQLKTSLNKFTNYKNEYNTYSSDIKGFQGPVDTRNCTRFSINMYDQLSPLGATDVVNAPAHEEFHDALSKSWKAFGIAGHATRMRVILAEGCPYLTRAEATNLYNLDTPLAIADGCGTSAWTPINGGKRCVISRPKSDNSFYTMPYNAKHIQAMITGFPFSNNFYNDEKVKVMCKGLKSGLTITDSLYGKTFDHIGEFIIYGDPLFHY